MTIFALKGLGLCEQERTLSYRKNTMVVKFNQNGGLYTKMSVCFTSAGVPSGHVKGSRIDKIRLLFQVSFIKEMKFIINFFFFLFCIFILCFCSFNEKENIIIISLVNGKYKYHSNGVEADSIETLSKYLKKDSSYHCFFEFKLTDEKKYNFLKDFSKYGVNIIKETEMSNNPCYFYKNNNIKGVPADMFEFTDGIH